MLYVLLMKPMSTNISPRVPTEVLDRYFAGQCTPEEAARVREAIEESETLSAVVHWVEGETVDVGAAWKRFVRMYWGWEDQRPAARPLQPRWRSDGRMSRRRGVWYMLATGVVAAVLVAGGIFGGERVLRRYMTPTQAYTTYATTNGQRATITLPDGNTILLSVASRLEVPTSYSAGNHTVRLPAGEALFTVTHHAGTPFTVETGRITARVLGTSFMVRRYTADTSTLVAVRDGKVAVGRTVITERKLVEVTRAGTSRVRTAAPSLFSFATGVLTVDSMPLASAIPELNRWYDADVRLGDPALGTQLVEGKFTAGSLADLSEILRLAFDVRVVRDGRVLTLYPREG